MKRLNKVSVAAFGLIVAASAMVFLSGAPTSAVGAHRNCNDDAIVRCGAVTESELLQKYDANSGDVQSVYRHYGISRSDLTGQTSEVKHGTVYQDGRIVVAGETVATNAYSLSRVAYNDNSGNAPRTVRINGKTYYEGPNMSIFVRSVDTYVFFRDGQFYKAVISSCANPLMATPVEKPKPAPQPVKPVEKPKPQPVKVIEKVVEVEKPQPVKVVEVVQEVEVEKEEEVVVTELPKTGLETVIGGSLGIGSISAAGYYWVASRKNLVSTLLNK